MPRRKASDSISEVLASAEVLRNRIAALSAEVREATKELALAIVNLHGKKRGRPPGKRPRPVASEDAHEVGTVGHPAGRERLEDLPRQQLPYRNIA